MAGRHREPVPPMSRGVLAAVLLLALATSGCKLLIPIAMLGEHTETIPAEYDKLPGKKVAICVWAPQEVLFDYPLLRLEISGHVYDRMSANMKDVEFVDVRRVEDYLQRTLALSIDPVLVGKEFSADAVIYLEMTDFHLRDPEAPDLVRGKAAASVTVYDLTANPDEPRQYELEPVSAEYPEHQTLQMTETNVLVARQQVYEKFAAIVARKFHAYEVDMQTGKPK